GRSLPFDRIQGSSKRLSKWVIRPDSSIEDSSLFRSAAGGPRPAIDCDRSYGGTMEITYKRHVSYPIGRVLSQYFDLEHLEYVHPQSFGRAHLVSEHHDAVVWDLEWPPILGLFRFRNRIVQQFILPNRIHVELVSGLFCGTTVDIQIHQTSGGS